MNIQIKLYAILRHLAGTDSLNLSLPEPATVNDLLNKLAHDHTELSPHLPQVAVIEGEAYIPKHHTLTPGKLISLLPPFSGGSHDFRYLTFDPIPTTSLLQSLENLHAGATVTFLGTVRAEGEKNPLVALEYEAHLTMAEMEIEKIIKEATARWPILTLHVQHRLGKVPLGEVSLFIGVTAAHRKEAFQATEHLLEAIKERVPIWKQEIFHNGTTKWAVGMPIQRAKEEIQAA